MRKRRVSICQRTWVPSSTKSHRWLHSMRVTSEQTLIKGKNFATLKWKGVRVEVWPIVGENSHGPAVPKPIC